MIHLYSWEQTARVEYQGLVYWVNGSDKPDALKMPNIRSLRAAGFNTPAEMKAARAAFAVTAYTLLTKGYKVDRKEYVPC